MRTYNFPPHPLIGATALAILFLNSHEPALATTEAATPPQVRTLNSAPEANAAAQPAVTAPAIGETASTPPQAGSQAPDQAAAPMPPKPVKPTLIARINLTTQTMTVQAGGKTVHNWKVSTGAPGYATPPGTFKPGWMAKDWRSRQYDNAPMPYSVFFNGGIAVHGTMNPGSLGRAASHGCVRVATSNAKTFFDLVGRHGMARTRIIVEGKQPFGRNDMVASRTHQQRLRQHEPNQWVYTSSQTGYRPIARTPVRRIDSYGYQPVPQARRVSVVRTQSTYWSR